MIPRLWLCALGLVGDENAGVCLCVCVDVCVVASVGVVCNVYDYCECRGSCVVLRGLCVRACVVCVCVCVMNGPCVPPFELFVMRLIVVSANVRVWCFVAKSAASTWCVFVRALNGPCVPTLESSVMRSINVSANVRVWC